VRNVAVDILTGFLGSGKTTLLRHVLEHGLKGKPVAVIMNEIGEVGIDGKVITGLSAVEKMVELASGCICCSIDDYKFDLAIQEIIDTAHPHLIIIESTGLADPEPLAYRVKNAGLGLDAVITVVDAANVERHLKEADVARAQLGRGLGLDTEALARLDRLQVLARNQLDGDTLPERYVHGAVHRTHRALSDLGENLVAPDAAQLPLSHGFLLACSASRSHRRTASASVASGASAR